MDTMIIIALGGCLFSAAVVYVVLDYRSHGERQVAMENVLNVQAKVTSGQKTLQGYTKYNDYLGATKQAAIEKAKTLTTKVVRDHILIDKILNEAPNPKSAVTVILKYTVEYVIGFDLKPDNLEILATTTGIEIKTRKPSLMGSPFIKTMSHELAAGGVLEKEQEWVRALHDKFAPQAQQYGMAVAAEEAMRALCDKKLVAQVSAFLAGQPGVAQVPVIAVVYA